MARGAEKDAMVRKRTKKTPDSKKVDKKKKLPLRNQEKEKEETHTVKYTEFSHEFALSQILDAIKDRYQGVPDDAQIHFCFDDDHDVTGVKVWWDRDEEILEP